MELELESPVSPEPEMEPESPAPPEPEMECVLVSKKAVALASKYEKNKGEDTWPQFEETTPFSTRAIQYISNHTALEVIVVIAILINTVTLAVQNPGNQFDFTDPWVNPFLDKLDLVLTTLFTVEMFIRIFAMGLSTDSERPYDVLFPGEMVDVCDPDDEAQVFSKDASQGRVALRVKIMDSGHRERRGWISAEEQVIDTGKQALGSCCCCKTKKKRMTSVNGVPLLDKNDTEPNGVLDKYDKDELPKGLSKKCIDPRSIRDMKTIRRKQQYTIREVGEDEKKPDPQLTFTTLVTTAKPDEHLEDIKSKSGLFENGSRLEVKQHVSVTRGDFSQNDVEANAARNYARGQPSSPADGKYLRWEWSLEGAENWTHFDEKSSQLLTDAKENLEPHSEPNRDGFVELKDSDGFGLAGLAAEDYLFKPDHCEVSTQWKGVTHNIENKQTKKKYDIRMIAVDIAYLSDAWNKLDFFVVITSWATVLLEVAEVELPFKTSSLRALRVMRVLRSMRFFSGIKTILSVLGQSVGEMGNIVGFLLFVYCILGIVGVQMFRGRLMYRCSASFPEPDSSGWKYEWMGIGDPNGPSDVFANSPYCYPGDSASKDPPWVNACEDSCTAWTESTVGNPDGFELASHDPNVPNTQWLPTEIFYRIDADDDFLLSDEEVRAMLGHMGVGAPRPALDSDVTAEKIKMRWQASTCTGTATLVQRTCAGSSSTEITSAATCTGTASTGGVFCDLVAGTDNSAACPVGCTYNPPVTPTCDLDATTDPTAVTLAPGQVPGGAAADCPIGCDDTAEYTPVCDLDATTDPAFVSAGGADCPTGCAYTPPMTGEEAGELGLTLFKQWWARENPCMPCYEAPSCRSLPATPDGALHKCYNFGNPGFGSHGFDHIVMSWHTIFIMMTNLYWWETAYQLEDVQGGLGSAISWVFGLIVVFMLSWVTVNMFVAVICDTFSDVLAQQAKFDEVDEEEEEEENSVEEKPAKLGSATSHLIVQPKSKGEDLNELDQKKQMQQQIDQNKKKIYLEVKGKENADGSQWYCEMPLAGPRPGYVDLFYKPKDPDSPDSAGHGDGSRFCPTKILLNPLFDNIIMCFILGNTVTLAMEHTAGPPDHLMREGLIVTLNNLGHVFNAVFIYEMITKIMGMGYLNYLAIPFNCLDHFIVGTSILNYFGDLLPGASAARLLRIFRLFRIAKVVRILYKYQSIKRLLDTVAGAGSMLANLTLFILFVVTVFAIMGMHLMGDNINTCSQPTGVMAGDPLSTCGADFSTHCKDMLALPAPLTATCAEDFCPTCPQAHRCDKTCELPCYCAMYDGDLSADGANGEIQRRHYENIGKAWLMAFQTLTGDDWCNQMYAYVNIFGWPAALFYAVVFIFNNYVLMNMFIAVILEGFAIENAAKEEKQVNDSRQARAEVIVDEMFKKEEVFELPRRQVFFLDWGVATDVALGCLHGKRWRFQTEGTSEYPDTLAEADFTRSDASKPAGINIRVTYKGTEAEKDPRVEYVDRKDGIPRTTYDAFIAREKRWNDTKVMVAKKRDVKGAVQTLTKFAEDVKVQLRNDAELREVCKLPRTEDLLPWLGSYKGSDKKKREVGYHHPDEPPQMDAPTRTLWKAFDCVKEGVGGIQPGTLGQLMWELGHKELTQQIEDDATAVVKRIKETNLGVQTPTGGHTPGSGPISQAITDGDGVGHALSESVELVKILGFESIKTWWLSKEGPDKSGKQVMTEAFANEKKNKKLLALRDKMLTAERDAGAVCDALDECKLQEGSSGGEIFEIADVDHSGSLNKDEVKKMFADEGMPLDDDEISYLFKKMDKYYSAEIDKKEFLDWLKSTDDLAENLRKRKLARAPWTLPLGLELIYSVGGVLSDIKKSKDDLQEHNLAQKERPTDAPAPSLTLWCEVLKSHDGLPKLLKDTKDQLCLEEPRGSEVVALMEAEEYSHPIRQMAERIVLNPWFERTVMIAIIISSVLLAMEGPHGSLRGLQRTAADKDATNDVEDLLSIVDTCFYSVFLFEFFSKLIAYGFWTTENAYIKDPWNKLDFVVVVFSTVNYLPGQSKSSLGRIFRLCRCLRPLRMINKFPSLQVIVGAIVDSLGTNTAVLGLSFMLFLIFGILGVNIFGGKFYHCTDGSIVGADQWTALMTGANTQAYAHLETATTMYDATRLAEVGLTAPPTTWAEIKLYADVGADELWEEGKDYELFKYTDPVTNAAVYAYPYRDPTDAGHLEKPKKLTLIEWSDMNDRILCLAGGAVWQNKPWHFDNTMAAISGMFTASTLAGWTDLMEMSMDVTGFDKQPVTNASAYFAVYWVLFVFLLAFFITNLFLGVLIDFIAMSDGSALTTDDQQEWTDLQRNTKSVKPPIEVLRKPEHPIRLACYNLTADPRKSTGWAMLGNFAIGANVIVMMLEFEGQSIYWEDLLDQINMGFLIYFTIDMVLKFVGLGPGMYWLDPWNKFDFIVVSISWIGDIVGFKASVARAFRAFRIALVLKNAKGLQALFRTLINSVKPSINICALLLLLFSLYAILGMQIFGGAPLYIKLHEYGQVQQTRQSNFHSYIEAMKLLFECSSGKDWKIVMYEVQAETGDAVAFLYFFTFFFFAVYILTNMFVAVIIDQFGACQREDGLSISLDNMIVFQKVWRAHALMHESEHAIKIKGGKNKVNIRQILKDVGLFTGQEQQSEKLDREHREAMGKYDDAIELEDMQSHYETAKDLLIQLRVVESDLFREGLSRQWSSALLSKDFAKADDAMQKLVKLDEDIDELKGEHLAPSCELVLKTGGTKEAVLNQFVKKADERDLGTSREIIKKQDLNAREEGRVAREVIDGVNVPPEELKKFDSGALVPHPEWKDEEMTPEEEDMPAVISWKEGEVHPLWEDWFKGVQENLREREREWPTFQRSFVKNLKNAICGTGKAAGDTREEEIEVHYFAVLEAVLLQSMRKAGNDNPDKDKKMQMVREDTKKSLKRVHQRIKSIDDPYDGIGDRISSRTIAPLAVAVTPQRALRSLPGQVELPAKPEKGSMLVSGEPGVKVVQWIIGTNREKHLNAISRKPEYMDDPDNQGRSEAATFKASREWQKRGVKIRARDMSNAIANAEGSGGAKAILERDRSVLERPNFAKELTETGDARRIPGVPAGCQYCVKQVDTPTCGTRMVVYLRMKEAFKSINVADQVLNWCTEKLPMHQVPAAVITIEDGSTRSIEKLVQAIDPAELFCPHGQDWSYPWEMHSLLFVDGWHLKEADTSTDETTLDYLDEAEVLVLKEAWVMIDPFYKVESPGGGSKCRTQTGYITTNEVIIALKLSGLYETPPEGTPEAMLWDDSVWQPRGKNINNAKSEEYPKEDKAHDEQEVYHLADIDRDMNGAVAIAWPEFLEIVAALQNPRKCRGGRQGLVRKQEHKSSTAVADARPG